MSEIKDRKSLEAWLKGRSREDAIAIAARAALRVLPVFWAWSFTDRAWKRDVTALPVLQCVLIAEVAARSPIAEIETVALVRALDDMSATTSSVIRAAVIAASAAAHSAGYSARAGARASRAVLAGRGALTNSIDVDIYWENMQRDCEALAFGKDLFTISLWYSENPLQKQWKAVSQELDAEYTLDVWHFWRNWYARMLDPVTYPPDWELYEQVALIKNSVWKDGPEAIAKRIAEIEAARQPKANPAERLAAQRLLHAALSDFSFDQAARLMRMVPFAEDVKFIRDPEKLARYLGDAEELRDDIETFSAALKAEGAAMQGAGYVATYLDRLLEEFSKTRQTEALNVGKIVKLGKTLDAARLDEVTCREFGTMRMGALAEIVDQLSDMTRQHFSETLLRFAPLEELELEAETSAWEYLNEMRQALEGFKAGQGGIPLNEADLAVLRDLADDAELAMRGLDSASGPAKASLHKEVNYRLALLTVTVALGKTRVKEITGPAFKGVDEILKGMKRAKGLSELWELLQKIWE